MSKDELIEAEWRGEALSWVGRRVRIIEGPSTEHGVQEEGIVICVDATDYRPAAWVKIDDGVGNPRRSYPSYRSCDLCWLYDPEADDYGPTWARPLGAEDHGRDDAAAKPERIAALRARSEGEA